MKKLKIILIGMMVIPGVTVAKVELPDFRPYGGLDYMFIDTVNYGGEANLGAVRGKLGAELNPYLALEGSVGTGVISDHDDRFNDKLKLTQIWGLYIRGILPLHDRIKVYGLLGVTRTEFEGTPADTGQTQSYHTAGYSYGLGFEVFPLDNLAIIVEFASLIDELEISGSRDENELEISGISIGAKYYF
ncbi:hypothetical protein PDESU_00401 [Pontiella desulfatans]|uniref:Outer membrane protein beta-barrel domain-containing protein n=1 Tax=Pontiella desulfatans TaxID=2750659 RepID=A0A6C2TWI0_PONDE|nr:porin family protein [Pontiella desulfatans]VGO11854.1 hypothetical protein PDESU_00401 [Pontiella desulfatans]